MTVVSRPLFRLDAGWPFVLAGLVMLVAVVVLPGRRAVHDMHAQLDVLQTQEVVMIERLNAYTQFLDGIRSGDPQLLRRLAASQLNLVPEGETPILVAASLDQTVPAWIDQTVAHVSVRDTPYADTLLIRLAEGRWRVWLLAASAFVIFLGLVLGPDMATRPKRRDRGDRAGLLPATIATATPIALLPAGSTEAFDADVAHDDTVHDVFAPIEAEAPSDTLDDMDFQPRFEDEPHTPDHIDGIAEPTIDCMAECGRFDEPTELDELAPIEEVATLDEVMVADTPRATDPADDLDTAPTDQAPTSLDDAATDPVTAPPAIFANEAPITLLSEPESCDLDEAVEAVALAAEPAESAEPEPTPLEEPTEDLCASDSTRFDDRPLDLTLENDEIIIDLDDVGADVDDLFDDDERI